MILYDSSGFALTGKDNTATLELFVKAEQSNGKIAWNDGQNWYLIVRAGDTIFKLLDNLYVQNGQVNYWSYWSYDEESPRLLVMVQDGAGIEEFSYTFDKDKDVFNRERLFATAGNIGMLDSNTSILKNEH